MDKLGFLSLVLILQKSETGFLSKFHAAQPEFSEKPGFLSSVLILLIDRTIYFFCNIIARADLRLVAALSQLNLTTFCFRYCFQIF